MQGLAEDLTPTFQAEILGAGRGIGNQRTWDSEAYPPRNYKLLGLVTCLIDGVRMADPIAV